jgi:hypothetical protein
VFAEIIAAAGYKQSNRAHLPRRERQFGYAAAQNWGICSQVQCHMADRASTRNIRQGDCG